MKYIDLTEGETLVITCVAKSEIPPPPMPTPSDDDLNVLLTIGGVNIYEGTNRDYVMFKSDLDVCNDGSGPAHGDPYHQAQTAYCSGGSDGGRYMNADKDPYIVVPPQIRAQVPGVVMGCRAKVTNVNTGVVLDAVVGDIGPETKTGECAYCLAKLLNPAIDYNTGDTNKSYLYELWPDQPATVNSFTYKLQPA